jgi:large subunit ribosomal protein L9
LLPKKIAMQATKVAMKNLDNKRKMLKLKIEEQIKEDKAIVEKLEAKKIIIKVKCGEAGKLFGSITNKEIADEISKQLSLEVDRKKIILDEPIKSLGDKVIEIKFRNDISAELKLEVVKE